MKIAKVACSLKRFLELVMNIVATHQFGWVETETLTKENRQRTQREFQPAYVHTRWNLVNSLLRLTRAQVYAFWALFISCVGFRLAGLRLGIKLILSILVNLGVLAFGFILNDAEDYQEDRLDARKSRRNLIAAGKISKGQAYLLSMGCATYSVALTALLDLRAMVVISGTLLLLFLYSWHITRLKAKFGIDLLVHGLIGGMLFIAAYLSTGSELDKGLSVGLAGLFFAVDSAVSLLKHQVVDMELDKQAGLRTTTVVLGKEIICRIISSLQWILILIVLLLIGTGGIPYLTVAVYAGTNLLALLVLLYRRKTGTTIDLKKYVWVTTKVGAIVALISWYFV